MSGFQLWCHRYTNDNTEKALLQSSFASINPISVVLERHKRNKSIIPGAINLSKPSIDPIYSDPIHYPIQPSDQTKGFITSIDLLICL